jgi:hypothetical protein
LRQRIGPRVTWSSSSDLAWADSVTAQ